MKNIIYITGNDSYGVEQEVQRWIAVFQGKYGDINIDHIRLEDRTSFPVIRDNLATSGLFTDKRLFLFSGGVEKKAKSGGFEEILEQIRENIPEDHFCIFHSISAKEEGMIAWLKANADVRLIDTVWNIAAWGKRFSLLETRDIRSIVETYQNDEGNREVTDRNPTIGHSIAGSLEMFSLLGVSGDTRNQSEIDSLIHTEGGGKIFDLVDMILAEKAKASILLLRRMTETMKSAELLPSLIGLLRSHIYIKFLFSEGKTANEIGNIIKVHPFVLRKSISSRVSFEKIRKFFQEILDINKAYKSGKGLQDGELGRIFAIELALMGLKK